VARKYSDYVVKQRVEEMQGRVRMRRRHRGQERQPSYGRLGDKREGTKGKENRDAEGTCRRGRRDAQEVRVADAIF
jgi:hypothetical protein